MLWDDAYVSVRINNGELQTKTTTKQINKAFTDTTSWHEYMISKVAYVIDPTDTYYLNAISDTYVYLDGELIGKADMTANYQNDEAVIGCRKGRDYFGNTSDGAYFDGKIDDVRISNRMIWDGTPATLGENIAPLGIGMVNSNGPTDYYLNDNNPNTTAQASGTSASMYINLIEANNINRVEFVADTVDYPVDYTIQTSNCYLGPWTTQATVTGNTETTRSHSFASTDAIYARLNVTASSGASAYKIKELRVFNADGSGSGEYSSIKDWNFNTDGNLEGWTMASANVTVSGGSLHLTATGYDPLMWAPNDLAIITPATYNKVRIRMQNNSSKTSAKIYFITNSDPSWNEAKAKAFTIIANSGYTDYVVDMSSVPGWTGTIKQIRVDPLDQAVSGQNVDIDYIRITN